MTTLFHPRSLRRSGRAALMLAPLLALAPAATGESLTFVSFQTGGEVLTSQNYPAIFDNPDQFHFQIGFETTEVAAPAFFADSLTISLYGPGPGKVLTLATLDVFGLTAAPSNPGGIFLESAAVAYTAVPPLVPATLPAPQAFDVVVSLPKDLAGQLPSVRLDFFDNQNGQASRGHVAIPQAIPEPSTVALLGIGIATLGWLSLRPGMRR